MPAEQPGPNSIRVLVRDSTRMGTQLLSAAIGRDRRFTVETIGALEDISTVQLPADVAVISTDLDDKPLGGFELTRHLHALCSKLRIVMLLDTPKPDFVLHAFKAGAQGVLCRNEPFTAVCKCIHAVHEGHVWANHEQLLIVLDAFSNGSPLCPLVEGEGTALLSRREQQVVSCVAKGLRNGEIAKQLNMSEHTVKHHLFRIFEKLGLSSRVEVALYACTQDQSHAAVLRSPMPTAGCTRRSSEVHHIQSRSQSSDDSEGNLITLCSDCRKAIHA